MKPFFPFLFLIFLTKILFSQGVNSNFGNVSKEDFLIDTIYNEHEAVVLSDITKTRFIDTLDNINLVQERTVRIKILSNEGESFGNIEIEYYNSNGAHEFITDIQANSYNIVEGELVISKALQSDIYWSKLNDQVSIKRVPIPNAKAGAIIEYRYTLYSQNLHIIRPWDIQWDIPVITSKYEFRTMPYYTYDWELKGRSRFDYDTTYVDSVNKVLFSDFNYPTRVIFMQFNNIPAFEEYPFVASIEDYRLRLNFQLSVVSLPLQQVYNFLISWEQLIDKLLKADDFGKAIRRSKRYAKKVIDVKTIKCLPSQVRYNVVLDFVKDNYVWNKKNWVYTEKKKDGLIKSKVGSSGDINLFTIGLLQAVDIDAKPVLISTRENGKISYCFPFVHRFNTVVISATIDSVGVLSSAIDSYLKNDRIPSYCINDKGLIIDSDSINWINLQFMFDSPSQKLFKLNIKDDNRINANVTSMFNEYEANYARNKYEDNKEILINEKNQNNITIIDSTITFKNLDKVQQPYICNYSVNYEPTIYNNKIIIHPFLNEPISSNPLTAKKRTCEIDFNYPFSRSYISMIELPEGYLVENKPQNLKITNNNFALDYSIKQNGNKFFISFNYKLNKSVYSAETYSELQDFYNQVVLKGNEKLILVKE